MKSDVAHLKGVMPTLGMLAGLLAVVITGTAMTESPATRIAQKKSAAVISEAHISPGDNDVESTQFLSEADFRSKLSLYRRHLEIRSLWALLPFFAYGILVVLLRNPSPESKNRVAGWLLGGMVACFFLMVAFIKRTKPDPVRYGVVCRACRGSLSHPSNTALTTGRCPACGVKLFHKPSKRNDVSSY